MLSVSVLMSFNGRWIPISRIRAPLLVRVGHAELVGEINVKLLQP